MFNKVLVCLVVLNLNISAKHQRICLQQALNFKLVKATAVSLGGYQGFCINVCLKNLSNDSLIVILEAGRRLNSIDEKTQDILITRQEIIALKKAENKSVKVKGYCCQAYNYAPLIGAKYDVNKLADSNLVMLSRYLNENNFESQAEQYAVWALSDSKSSAQITSVNDSLITPLKKMVCALKGEVLPWYSIVSSTYVFRNAVIITTPLYLRGNLEYTIDADSYATMHILNAKGIEVGKIVSKWLLAGKNQNYTLNIPIKNLNKGKYIVELKTVQKQLAIKEFEI
jgi:hypothetical protein